ncbi:hypothetical protein ACGFYF_33765 [Streptomyces lavendulae]|uniref:hypothetical protein n=1 Tax=Streptomyces lavendulae TaxID=1914 RepID=UPI003711AB90
MDDDELLAWIEGESEDWDIPEELRGPANGIVVNFAIIVLSSRFASSVINQAVGRLVVEGEGFTNWFSSEAKGSLEPIALLRLSEMSACLVRPCWESWKAYERAFEEHVTAFPSVEARSLLKALADAHRGFKDARVS